jgi:hypothetical protein
VVRSTSWVSDVCGNSTAMSYIGLNNYSANTLIADSTWRTAICNSTYFESVLNVKVPTMTSNTTPSGECFADSEYSSGALSFNAYKAFDNNDSNTSIWASAKAKNSTDVYVGYRFTNAVKIVKISTFWLNWTNTQYKIQGSSDGSNYVDINTFTDTTSATINNHILNNTNNYQYYRMYCISQTGDNSLGGNIKTLQLYGRADV